MKKHIKAFIFDIDGTLLDSNEAHAVTWWEAFRDAGFDLPLDRVRKAVGMGADHLIPSLIPVAADSEMAKRIGREKGRHFAREYADQLRPFPEARELLDDLVRRGYRLAVATSADRTEMHAFLDRVGAGAADRFEVKISADDVDASKPSADLVSAALEKLGVGAAEALMVGDTPYDVEAARKANVKTIAVRSGGNNDKALAAAALIVDDVRELRREILGGWEPGS